LTAWYFFSPTTSELVAPVMDTGQEIDASMRQKIVSYLKARVRATSEGKGGYRGQVISAMIDADYELKVGDKVLKGKGELLSLTAKEAAETHGDPPQPLLAAGAELRDELVFQPGRGLPRQQGRARGADAARKRDEETSRP
jgi:membrane-bound serine protease (ClpP class)